jgi:hypothetical protein
MTLRESYGVTQLFPADPNGSSTVRHPRIVKRRFTDAEDRLISSLVGELGSHDWGTIARRLGTRTARQCRERWRHYLRPVIASGPWTREEDALLKQQVARYGPRWSQISALFTGRTEVNLKNRWTKLARGKAHGFGNELQAEDGAQDPRAVLPSISRLLTHVDRRDGDFLHMVLNTETEG